MWTFDVNYVTRENSYVQLLAPLRVFLPLLRDLRQTSTERFVKPAVVRDFWNIALPTCDWAVQGVISCHVTGQCKES